MPLTVGVTEFQYLIASWCDIDASGAASTPEREEIVEASVLSGIAVYVLCVIDVNVQRREDIDE